MNRRNFIKKGGIYVPAASVLGFPNIVKGAIQNHHAAVARKKVSERTYTEVNNNFSECSSGFYFGTYWQTLGGQFPATETYTLTRVKLKLRKSGSPTGTITCWLYSQNNQTSNTDMPDDRQGTALATVDAADLPTSFGDGTIFDFDGVSLTSGNRYYIVINHSGSNATNFIDWQRDTFKGNDYGIAGRPSGIPNATDDDINWTEDWDTDGAFGIKTYKSP